MNGITYSPEVARRPLQMRDALLQNDSQEAYHILYSIASPNFDKPSDDVWTKMEEKAKVENDVSKPETCFVLFSVWGFVRDFVDENLKLEIVGIYFNEKDATENKLKFELKWYGLKGIQRPDPKSELFN